MKKLLIILLMAICAWEAWDYTHPQPVERYVVRAVAAEGDTLWHLVGDTMQREGDRRDVREVIHYAKKISNLKGTLQPGDIVLIPIEVAASK